MMRNMISSGVFDQIDGSMCTVPPMVNPETGGPRMGQTPNSQGISGSLALLTKLQDVYENANPARDGEELGFLKMRGW